MIRTLQFSLAAAVFLVGVAAHAEKYVVHIENGKFTPPSITVGLGDTVEFQNISTGTHTVTADPALAANPANVELPAGAAPFDSGRLTPGKTFAHTFDVEGTYRYVCLPHEKFGMKGTVVVTDGDDDGASDLE